MRRFLLVLGLAMVAVPALAMYTSNLATEAMFDSAFAEAVSRRLGNAVSMALAGRPDFAKELLQEAEQYSQLAETIDEN